MFTGLALISKPRSLRSELFVKGVSSTKKFSSGCSARKPFNNCPKTKWWKSGLKSAFGKYLILTNTLMSGSMMSIGDLIQQEIEYHREGKHKDSFDWNRNKNMAIVGLCQGPFMHLFYSTMDKYIPEVNMKTVFKKIFIDQTVGSPILISTFFIGVGYLAGQKFDEIMNELKKKFFWVYAVDCVIWIPVQFINFFWVSNKFRVIYVNLVVMGYNTFLSFMKFDI